jgi:hypothetical protein
MFENITQLTPSAVSEMEEIAQAIKFITNSEDITVLEKTSALRALAERLQEACFQAEQAYHTLREGV